ncbi:MAG: hypothetical protein NTY53_24730, partial [Kiritimatiellaeota bacterium]|nr:hypothetical protein [Kiritimatiellota bacterium]
MADSESWPGEIETPASAGAADVWPGQILSGASQNTWPGTIEAPPSPTVGTPEQPFSQGSENAPADPYAAASFEELQQRQAEDQRSLDQRYEDATAPHRLQEYAQRRQQEPQRPPQELDAAIKQDWAVPQMGYDLLPNPVGRAIGYVARGGAFGADEADLARRQKEHLQQRWDKTAAVRLADYQRLRQQFPDRAPQEISDVVNRHYGLAGTDFTGMNSGAVRPTERSVAGEVTTGLERFFAVDAPDAFAAIVRAVTPRDSVAYKWARSINEDSEFIGKQVPNQAASLDPELHPGTAAFRQGAEMLPISVVPNIAAGRLMLGFGVPTRIARFLGPALGLIPDVVQQGYQSRDKVEQALLDKGENPDTARRMAQLAGVFSGFIEGFGETVDDFFGPQSAVFKALGMGWVGKKSMREALVSLAEKQLPRQAAEEFIKEFLFKTMPIETATEMGQQFGEASVEQAFGAPANEGTPWEQAKAVIGPTLAMNVLMLPGIGMGVGAQVQQHNTVHQLLTDGQANPVERLSAGTLVLEQLKELDKRAAVRFRNELETALNQEQPLPLENFERFFNAKPQSSAQGAEVALGTPGQQTPIDLSTAAGQRDLQQEAEFHKFDAAIPEGSPDDPNGEIFNEIFGQGMQESKALAASGAPVVTAATLVDRFRQRVAELKGVSAAMPAPPLSAVEAPPGVPVASPPTAPGGPTAAVLPSTASAPSASTAASPAAVPLGLATALGGPGSAADEQAKAIIEAKARGETPAPAVGPVTTPGATPQPPREVTRPTA